MPQLSCLQLWPIEALAGEWVVGQHGVPFCNIPWASPSTNPSHLCTCRYVTCPGLCPTLVRVETESGAHSSTRAAPGKVFNESLIIVVLICARQINKYALDGARPGGDHRLNLSSAPMTQNTFNSCLPFCWRPGFD
ncbi:hypothetical protein FIBSPDRAFT_900542 [Athelia psychrophila]|uniref:Uncharacterized protein n=1 Tax=Athelia psychrophila TaxID=1759441 RepID=A0A165YB03_9AGAM|nr:hypothetical protein FIBSPDRAFT_900542 [Fibularhizoctonia sp. CBS 109695]